jgi:hypothetical protein
MSSDASDAWAMAGLLIGIAGAFGLTFAYRRR